MFFRLVAVALCAVLLACGADPDTRAQPQSAPPTQLILTGDGELWVVDVDSQTVRHRAVRELAPGNPPDRVVRRGDRFVFWGYDTYAVRDPGQPLERIAGGTWFFIPSAREDRVWVAVLDPASPATRNALEAVREITTAGEITVGDAEPPGGDWPQRALGSGLLFFRDGAWLVWDPRTRVEVSRLDLGGDLGPSHGNTIASCAVDSCRELWITDASTGARRTARAPAGWRFQMWTGSFSPDGARLAVAVTPAPEDSNEGDSTLALLDVGDRDLEVTMVEGSTVEPYYVFTDWSADGREVFMTGGKRFEPRTILAYRIGEPAARKLDVQVGDFYDMAAR